jgi:predicted transcriptional regulator
MLGRLLQALHLTCAHRRLSRPISNASTREHRPPTNNQWKAVGEETGDYVVCLDCGREFPYDWEKMQIKRGA